MCPCSRKLAWGIWCSGITSASHAEGPGLNPQCVHFSCQSCSHSSIAHVGDLWVNIVGSGEPYTTRVSLDDAAPHCSLSLGNTGSQQVARLRLFFLRSIARNAAVDSQIKAMWEASKCIPYNLCQPDHLKLWPKEDRRHSHRKPILCFKLM